jgi:hypothetical protein
MYFKMLQTQEIWKSGSVIKVPNLCNITDKI